MSRPPNDAIVERNRALVDYFKQQIDLIGTEGGPKFAPRNDALGAMFGMKFQTVQNVLKAAGIVNGNYRRKRLQVDDQPVISNFHALLGAELARLVHSLVLQGLVTSPAVTEIGLYLRMSPQHLTRIFSGHADPGISDLLRITNACNVQVSDLILKVQKMEQNACVRQNATSLPTGSTGAQPMKPSETRLYPS